MPSSPLGYSLPVTDQYAMHREIREIWNGFREPIEWARDSVQGVIEYIEGIDHPGIFALLPPLFPIPTTKTRHETKLQIEEKREKMLDWISNVPFNQHHSNIRQDRLPDSGQWLLQKKEYKIWLEDSSCSILWLHGIRMHLMILCW